MRIFLLALLIIPLTLNSAQNDVSAQNEPSIIKRSEFDKWLASTTKKLNEKGVVVHTLLGDIQTVIKGEGPAILVLHGGFGGWDQGELVAQNLSDQGFKVIIPSRPGYLSSPIYTNPILLEETTPAQQADLMVALLNQLKIKKVVVMGFSAGAPVAYEFGFFRH